MSCIALSPCHDYCTRTTEQEILTGGNFYKHIATWSSHGLSEIQRKQHLLPAVWDTALQGKQANQGVSAPCLTNQLPNAALANLRNSCTRKPGEMVPLSHVDKTWKGPHSWSPGVENPLRHPLRCLKPETSRINCHTACIFHKSKDSISFLDRSKIHSLHFTMYFSSCFHGLIRLSIQVILC